MPHLPCKLQTSVSYKPMHGYPVTITVLLCSYKKCLNLNLILTDPQVPYRVSFDAVVCESNISIYDDTVFTVPGKNFIFYFTYTPASLIILAKPGVDIGSPTINSASRLTEDPSKARVEWTPTANVVDVQIYSGNTFNEVHTCGQ